MSLTTTKQSKMITYSGKLFLNETGIDFTIQNLKKEKNAKTEKDHLEAHIRRRKKHTHIPNEKLV
jgi:hypothetical protein